MAKQNMKQDYTRYVRTGAPDECWVWFGARQRFGHGMFKVNGKLMLAHRLAYELNNGPFAPGLCVCHRCDNPPCCNPAHLFLGTRAENNQDRHRKGRNAKVRALPTGDDHWSRRHPEKTAKGEAHGRAKLTAAQVVEMRELSFAGAKPADLMLRYGVTRTGLHLILKGLQWTEVGGPTVARGKRAKLSPDDVRVIREALAHGETRTQLAARYSVAYPTIRSIDLDIGHRRVA